MLMKSMQYIKAAISRIGPGMKINPLKGLGNTMLKGQTLVSVSVLGIVYYGKNALFPYVILLYTFRLILMCLCYFFLSFYIWLNI